jgi:protein SCO1/2
MLLELRRSARGRGWGARSALWLALLGCGCSIRPDPVRWPASTSIFGLRGNWSDEHGQLQQFSHWQGRPLVLTMFYRSCQTRCPLTLSKLQRVASALKARNIQANFVLVTLDPRNDTPEHLAAFKSAHGLPEDSWHLLNGSDQQTRGLAHLLGLRVAYDEGHIDHDVKIWFFDAAGYPLRVYSGWGFDDDALTQTQPH